MKKTWGVVFYTPERKNKTVTIFDTTLRDGEQTPGVTIPVEKKIEIAYQLDKLGVDAIEAGFPISSPGDKEAVKRIAGLGLSSDICGLARSVIKDIDACIDCDVDMIHAFIPTSDIQREHTIRKTREETLSAAVDVVDYIKSHGFKCMFSPMDATRTDFDYLVQVSKAVKNTGCDIVNIPDTVGVMVPTATYKLVQELCQQVDMKYDVHCHNDFGLANANSITAIEAGASQVQVTVNGIGERAGNASLAEVVMALTSIYGYKTNIKTEYLTETSRLVERITGVKMPPTIPIVGDNAFSHESGIHTQGVLEKSATFEPGIMTPEMVGQKRRIVLGKHAGKHAVLKNLENAGIVPNDEQLQEILAKIKEIGDRGKTVTDADLYVVASIVLGKRGIDEAIKLNEVSVMTGNRVTPTAVIRADINGKEMIAAGTGVGPVDAALGAVEKIVGDTKFKVQDFSIEAISGGADSLAKVTITLENEKGKTVTAKSANADIVMASVEALVNAMNALFTMD
ncbi:2-isopropylmalate synthase [Methanolapillus africanus]|uniref:2-isopropylmalate synthase n=1 Tax=Methanolapillus africanus TaxID=3028297 RepID=UPI0030B8A8F7